MKPITVAPAGDVEDVTRCRFCGCTEDRPCPGGCAWATAEQQIAAGLEPMNGDLCTGCLTKESPSHDRAMELVDAAARDLPQPARGAILAVVLIHHSQPAPGTGPDPDCKGCQGRGRVGGDHCHCQCPVCVGCYEAVCGGPCPTIEALLLGLVPSPVARA